MKNNVLIIGAGPAGLAVAGRLSRMGIPFSIVEASSNVASSWRKHYDRLCLHTVKELSNLPYMEFPKEYPRYIPRDLLVKYYQDYSEKFDIQPLFGYKLVRIRSKNDVWNCTFDNGEERQVKHLVLATGVNRRSYSPDWRGMETYGGRIIHSREYKNPQPFENARVLVVGMGNTGAEISLDLANAGVDVTLSVRDKVLIVPRDIFGNPSQVTANRLAKMPFGWGHAIGNAVRKLVIGDLSKYGLEINPVPPVKHLAETGKSPVLDLGTVKAIKEGKIKVIGGIQSFQSKGIETERGEHVEFDQVILATGYKAGLEEFLDLPDEYVDQNSLPKEPIGVGEWKGLYFPGFDNYQLGGILGAIFRDSEKIVRTIAENVPSVQA